jgi:hypothetical protein
MVKSYQPDSAVGDDPTTRNPSMKITPTGLQPTEETQRAKAAVPTEGSSTPFPARLRSSRRHRCRWERAAPIRQTGGLVP